MNNCLEQEEIKCMIQDITNLLTGGMWDLELKNEVWCSLLRFSIDNYYQYINKWLIKNNFGDFFGKNVSNLDICLGLTTSSVDRELIFAKTFSEEVGLAAAGGRFELKKDFVQIKEGQQAYQIPANREIKHVFFTTPSSIDPAKFASWGYGNIAISEYGAFGFLGGLGLNYGTGGIFPMFPAHDVLLRAAHFNLNERLFESELTYKITKGPNDTKILHVFSVPPHKYGLRKELYNCYVWYEYYDTSDFNDEDKAKCQADCEKIYSPHQIDLKKQDYCDLNDLSKTFVRRWLTALAKEAIGRARGKFKGKIANLGGQELELDYDLFLAESKDEVSGIKDEIKEFLDDLDTDVQLEKKANQTDNLRRIQGGVPLGIYVK